MEEMRHAAAKPRRSRSESCGVARTLIISIESLTTSHPPATPNILLEQREQKAHQHIIAAWKRITGLNNPRFRRAATDAFQSRLRG
jgi:hypothetical protein